MASPVTATAIPLPPLEVALGHWQAEGVVVTPVAGVREDCPIVVKEDPSDGRHWVHARALLSIPKGGRLVFRLALRPLNLPALRLRADIGGKQIANGTLDFAGGQALPGDFESVTISPTAQGQLLVEASCSSTGECDYVNFGLMFDRGGQKYDYPGGSASLIVDSVTVHVAPPPSTSAGKRSRYSAYGRAAFRLCKGRGLEIGALHLPFDLDAHVTYLDYDKTANLRRAYQKDPTVGDIPQVQLVWKGVSYPFLDDEAFDFVVNSHVLEHVANPGRVIEEWLRIIRPGGVLYMVVPDKNYTFDRPRALTTLEHLMEDFESRLETIPLEHYEDYVRNRERPPRSPDDPPPNFDEMIAKAFKRQSSLHVHTFTADSLKQFLQVLGERLDFALEHFEAQGVHIHVALRKAAAPRDCL